MKIKVNVMLNCIYLFIFVVTAQIKIYTVQLEKNKAYRKRNTIQNTYESIHRIKDKKREKKELNK